MDHWTINRKLDGRFEAITRTPTRKRLSARGSTPEEALRKLSKKWEAWRNGADES